MDTPIKKSSIKAPTQATIPNTAVTHNFGGYNDSELRDMINDLNTRLTRLERLIDGDNSHTNQPLYCCRWKISGEYSNEPFTAEELERKLNNYYENWRDYTPNIALFNEIVNNIHDGYITAERAIEMSMYKALNTSSVEFDEEGKMYIQQYGDLVVSDPNEPVIPIYTCNWKVVDLGTTKFTAEELEHRLDAYYEDWRNNMINVALVNSIMNNIYPGFVTARYAISKAMYSALMTLSVDLDAEDKWTIEPLY